MRHSQPSTINSPSTLPRAACLPPCLTCNEQPQRPEACVVGDAAQHKNQQDGGCVAKHGAHRQECVQGLRVCVALHVIDVLCRIDCWLNRWVMPSAAGVTGMLCRAVKCASVVPAIQLRRHSTSCVPNYKRTLHTHTAHTLPYLHTLSTGFLGQVSRQ